MHQHTRIARRGLAVLSVLALAGCGGADGEPDGGADAAGSCPGEVAVVVASIGQWGELVQRLGGDCVALTTIANSPAIDPHDFEPGTAELAAFTGADLVVLNGAHYDEWAENVVDTLDDPVVIRAADVAGVGERADPHLWYDPEIVEQMATEITARLAAHEPAAADYIAERAQVWDEAMAEYRAAIDELRTVATGRSYAASETVFDRMAAAVGLDDRTPEGYRRAVSNDGEPAPGDLAALRSLLADGDVDVLIVNTQTAGGLSGTLAEDAAAGDIPIVAVTESQPRAVGSFLEWQVSQLQELTQALSMAP